MDRLFRRAMSSGGPKVEDVLRSPKWPLTWPFSPQDFGRLDESDDGYFYAQPRIGVLHIDNGAIRSLKKFYAKNLPPKANILDLCSSWVSHLPEDYEPQGLTILGMSPAELDANPRATRRVTQDLNKEPKLPFDDNEFDVITNVVSVDYLSRPLEVFQEMNRVLKPGGKAIMSFSNRCFPTKAIDIWCRTADIEHVFIVGCYFHYAGGFDSPQAHDLSPGLFGMGDPMFVVEASKI
ncbi:Putative Ubiquinone/menaquinone biosynthesis methyltransferase-like protein [Chondrus crispus]|uniref:Putative Ubiquinone/menaquinone biosynthesis methyltransferase-like protein n=1 Tax=Chondrus crispus TaxID=2769 RepID=R7QAM8_CHOCR|nr:Putative Ubiquinone/menaquinone biosynthesis methyltransferase-like protein [Chondrus crispus]CDF35557.1 Putative Ubiquinone/menaquinone biosynthesis methyltransferase-like protein [Chondrus crispus]|eukprot:XP_005715376.1 Putative Ubiquinone/menaquinone biosynthesis methyltransferase-like protein [Chondrus crispus]